MAASPRFKVYAPDREYIASCKYAEDAVALASLHGDDATVRLNHGDVLWREGAEEISGQESYDRAAQIVYNREYALLRRARDVRGS